MNRQRGYINIPSGTFEFLGILALIGLVSLIGAGLYGIYWLFTHIQFV